MWCMIYILDEDSWFLPLWWHFWLRPCWRRAWFCPRPGGSRSAGRRSLCHRDPCPSYQSGPRKSGWRRCCRNQFVGTFSSPPKTRLCPLFRCRWHHNLSMLNQTLLDLWLCIAMFTIMGHNFQPKTDAKIYVSHQQYNKQGNPAFSYRTGFY